MTRAIQNFSAILYILSIQIRSKSRQGVRVKQKTHCFVAACFNLNQLVNEQQD